MLQQFRGAVATADKQRSCASVMDKSSHRFQFLPIPIRVNVVLVTFTARKATGLLKLRHPSETSSLLQHLDNVKTLVIQQMHMDATN